MKGPHKTCKRPGSEETASILVSAVVGAAVLAIVAGGFLTFVSNEYALNLRSHAWTQALHLAEAGVDTAFAEFNYYYATGGAAFDSSRGWINLGGGSYLRFVYPFYDNNNKPLGATYSYVHGVGSANPWVSGYGNCPTTPRGPVVWRRVDVVLRPITRFPAAMVSKERIDMQGNNVYTDSYDSTDPTKSTSNRYDSAKRQANGDIASNDTVTNTVDIALGNAEVYGYILVSPNGTVTFGPNGSCGPTFVPSERAGTVAEALSSGYLRKDFQVDIPDVTLPSGAGSWLSLGSINGSRTITAGDYQASDITIAGNSTVTISGGRVRLYVTGDIRSTGNSLIRIEPGASLEIYAAGSVRIAGDGVVNDALTPLNCQFYGLPTSTSWDLSGNGQWVGTVYAPNAALSMCGGGARGDMSGAVVARSITMTGQVQFHYDESLRRIGPGAGYNLASWKSWRYDASSSTWISD